MSYFESFILGLVQGLGEFLPISSSAHLVILPWIAKFKDPGLGFDVALHFGTLIAVIAYFWRDWFQIVTGACQFSLTKKHEHRSNFHLLLKLIIATVPAAIVGVLLDEWAETTLREPLIVAFNMVFLGALLMYADKKEGSGSLLDITYSIAILIGVSQAFALLPGVSRSGITITAALALGLSRSSAARFSFLLSMPIILGACVFKYKYFLDAFNNPQALFGILVAGLFGFLSIKYLMKLIQTRSFAVFCYYRFLFGGVVALVWFL